MQMSARAYQRVTLLAVWALAIIIVSGAAVRLTGSGLGCTDWPTCEDSQFHPPLDNVHGLVEFGNRLFTGVVSLAVIAAVLGARRRVPYRRDLVWWAWGLVAGVLAQILIGAFVVKLELVPGVVMVHFLVSMLLVWNALVLHHEAGRADPPPPRPPRHPLATHAAAVAAVATAVLVAGTVVTGAGPHAGDEGAERLAVSVPDAAQVHGALVWLLLAGVVALAWRLRQQPDTQTDVTSTWPYLIRLLALIVAQGTVGYVQYFTDVPTLLVAIHVAGATAVWVAVVVLYLHLRELPPAVPSPASHEPVEASVGNP